MANLRDYLRIGEAAEFVGVSAQTLRNWEMAGKLPAYRNPLNRYRLYKREDLIRLLEKVEKSTPHGPKQRGRGK